MPYFRKKPIVIEAMQHDGSPQSADRIREWSKGKLTDHWMGGKDKKLSTEFYIYTLEGTMTAGPNDWIIKGVKGEFYPCKPDIFEATYEAVEE